jgi:ribosomal protein L37AE/L43A
MAKKEKEEKKKTKGRACSKCGSHFVYVRIKEGSVVCRSCGNIDPIED